MKYVLALDQGTTSTRAIIFDEQLNIVSAAQQEFNQIYPAMGWVEHSPRDIYGSSVAVMAEALARASLSASQISSIGITNQRETTLVWNAKTGEPVYNAIVWQCRRTADICETLKKEGYSELIYSKTGLVPDAYFSATKIKWILDNVSGARAAAERGELCFGTVDTYLLWRLTGGKIHATDYTNAARTMLFNIHTLEWDEELLKLFSIPRSMLPQVYPSSHCFGYTDASLFGAAVPVCGIAGDQQAALFGQLCTNKGDVKNTYGTGCFLLMNTGYEAVKSHNGLITTLAAAEDDRPRYALEGSAFVAGAVVQWLRDGLKIISSAAESEELAQSVQDNGGVYFVPALTGLGAPYWEASARGTITGITRGVTRGHIVRAALEGIAYETSDLVRAMEEDAGVKISRLAVDGGASVNGFLMGFQADILGATVACAAISETTALGAALLSGLKSGVWNGLDEVKKKLGGGKVYEPKMNAAEREKLLNGWKAAVKKTLLK